MRARVRGEKTLEAVDSVTAQGKRHRCLIALSYVERKERKERENELYTVLCCARSWHNSLVKDSCCVRERNRKIQDVTAQGKRH